MMNYLKPALVLLFSVCFVMTANGYELKITGGTFFGPGAMVDTPLPTGRLAHIEFSAPLKGETKFFNNGPAEPNVPFEKDIFGKIEGKLSNGVMFNEHVYGGIAVVGRGAMRFFTVIAYGGPNNGTEKYELQDNLDLEIRTDLALDPGFKEGLVISNNIRITTGILWVPLSLQSQQQMIGGTDKAGSLPSGAPILGALGDDDADGFMDGTIVGVGNIQLDHMFLPGAPVVQARHFKSDILIPYQDSATFTLASIRHVAGIWKRAKMGRFPIAAQQYVLKNMDNYFDSVLLRCQSTRNLLNKFLAANSQPQLADTVKRIVTDLNRILSRSNDLKKIVMAIRVNGSFEQPGSAEIEQIFETAARTSEEMKTIFNIKQRYQL
jgi:hypothetical protein